MPNLIETLFQQAHSERSVLGVISDAHRGMIVGRLGVQTHSLASLFLVDETGNPDGVFWLLWDSISEVRIRTPYLEAVLAAEARQEQKVVTKTDCPQLAPTDGLRELLTWIASRNLFVSLGRAGETYSHARVVEVDDSTLTYEQYSTDHELEGLFRTQLDEIRFVEYGSGELLPLQRSQGSQSSQEPF